MKTFYAMTIQKGEESEPGRRYVEDEFNSLVNFTFLSGVTDNVYGMMNEKLSSLPQIFSWTVSPFHRPIPLQPRASAWCHYVGARTQCES